MKLKNIFISLLCFLLLSACKKNFLDRQPESEISPDIFFNTEKDLILYTNSFYNALPSAEGIYNEDVDNIVKQSLSDILTGKRVVPITDGNWGWGELRKINYFLDNYGTKIPANVSIKYVAIARFFRAWLYSELVHKYGDVPWYSHHIDEKDEAALTKARDPRTLVMDSVLADIDFAIENLPAEKNVEKVTKWTALALKSRIGLFEGTFRKYHTEFTLPDADKFLTAAADAGRELLSEGPYQLNTSDPNTAYGELFSSVEAKENEIILTRRFSQSLQIWHNVNYYTITSSYGRPGLEKQLMDSYLMKDGSRFTDLPNYTKKTFSEEVKDRDPRLSQTIRTPGYMRIGGTLKEAPQFGASMTGYQLIKFVGSVAYDSFNRSENDMPIFRLAEVMLNFAEAKAELGLISQPDIDLSINKLRDRVAMPHLILTDAMANPDAFLSAQYTHVTSTNKGIILEIRRERRIELVMESFRWDDLMRWKEGHLLTRQFKGMYFPAPGAYDLDNDGKPDVHLYTDSKPSGTGIQFLQLGKEIILENGNSGNVIINPNIPKTFNENRDYLYPIPVQEMQLNPNLTQNPGWQ